ncbi:MAG TPA: hypothetical protein PK657_11250 [Legionella sp.]|nr:hypothetical protein [Legionella sp.]
MAKNLFKKIVLMGAMSLFVLFAPLSMAKEQSDSAEIIISLSSGKGHQIRPCPHPSLFAYCTLTISSGTGFTGAIQITNQSSSITATNIRAIIPASLSGIVFANPPASINLAPGASGNLSFTASGNEPPTLIEVRGDNTQPGYFYLEILP